MDEIKEKNNILIDQPKKKSSNKFVLFISLLLIFIIALYFFVNKFIDNEQIVEKKIKENPDAMIISTSPDAHKKYSLHAIENKIPFFTEVNTMNPNDMQEIIDKMKKNNVKGIPSSNLRFHPSIILLKKI